MGAAASASRRASTPRPLPAEAPQPHAASGVAVLGAPPSPGEPVARPLLGIFGARPPRHHLETTISVLAADLTAAKQRCAAAERDLQEAVYEREQQGVPRTECVVCMAACVSTVLLPCGHLCLCQECADLLLASAATRKEQRLRTHGRRGPQDLRRPGGAASSSGSPALWIPLG